MISAPFPVDEWSTNFSHTVVPLHTIQPGGPPRDGIPSIDDPRFETTTTAAAWLDDREPVQVLEIDGDARAYPTRILLWHEIVNDTVGGVPISVTYCPLCNTAIVFKRDVPHVGPVEFGVTGNLYMGALVMYDRTTETWFSQISGTAIVGELAGVQLEMLPSTLTSWAEFRRAHPHGRVLSIETGFGRPYGRSPYPGLDTWNPAAREPGDDRPLPMERVVTVMLDDQPVAFPFSALADSHLIHWGDDWGDVVVFYRRGTISPLDTGFIADSRDIGSAAVYRPTAAGLSLTFEYVDDGFRDGETGSTWSLLGEAIAGPLQGERLEPVLHGNHFWFSWVIYQPETLIVRGG